MEMIIMLFLIATSVFLFYVKTDNDIELKKLNEDLEKSKKSNQDKVKLIQNLDIKVTLLKENNEKCSDKLIKLQEAHSSYILKTNQLKKYSIIIDIEKEIDRLKSVAEDEVKEEKLKARGIKEKIELEYNNANLIARQIEEDAILNAKKIAGNAYIAKENAEQYEATVKAMKNIIDGYGNEYLLPTSSILDDLASEYSHKEVGQELARQRTLIKSMVKNNKAADCDYVEQNRKITAIEFALDAYNGKVDTILSKVKHDNYGKLLQQLEDAFRLVNHNGKAFRNARILSSYHEAIVKQLKLAITTQELKRIDMEEQRKIKEQMREEEKARREYEKAIKESEKEEKMLQKAMAEARKQLEHATQEERESFEIRLRELESQLTIAEEKGQRAMSMAQMTRTGHVYVISNIGSFGENIFKIGMTRRLEPLDRVKELGDASVPFSFDVHAMIQSEDAPTLEKKLHKLFENKQVNKVNHRKEFFNVGIHEIKEVVEQEGYTLHWTMKAEALEFYETKTIENIL